MERLSALKLAYAIVTEKRNANRYCMTQIRDRNTMEVTASYGDAVQIIKDLFEEEIKKQEAANESSN